jgi:hypothetical protein
MSNALFFLIAAICIFVIAAVLAFVSTVSLLTVVGIVCVGLAAFAAGHVGP